MPVSAYVMINTRVGKAKDVLEELGKISGCKSACTVTGRFDIIVLLEAEDLKTLTSTILEKIHKIEGIERTETAIIV